LRDLKSDLALEAAVLPPYIGGVRGLLRTMDINALVISGSDPGAVPGDSTNSPSFGASGVEIGSTNV